jgi:hypothetical protein
VSEIHMKKRGHDVADVGSRGWRPGLSPIAPPGLLEQTLTSSGRLYALCSPVVSHPGRATARRLASTDPIGPAPSLHGCLPKSQPDNVFGQKPYGQGKSAQRSARICGLFKSGDWRGDHRDPTRRPAKATRSIQSDRVAAGRC